MSFGGSRWSQLKPNLGFRIGFQTKDIRVLKVWGTGREGELSVKGKYNGGALFGKGGGDITGIPQPGSLAEAHAIYMKGGNPVKGDLVKRGRKLD